MAIQAIMQSQINDPWRSKLIKLADSGAVMFVHPCCKCGDKNAPFGINEMPLKHKKSDNYPICNWKNIKWFCTKCKPKKAIPSLQTKLL